MIASLARGLRLFSVFIMASWMLYSSMMKLVPYPGMEESFMVWGYEKWEMQLIGVAELILAIAVFAKPTRNYAFVGLIFLMTGALYTHISNYEYEETGPATWILVTSIVLLAWDVLALGKYFEKWTT